MFHMIDTAIFTYNLVPPKSRSGPKGCHMHRIPSHIAAIPRTGTRTADFV